MAEKHFEGRVRAYMRREMAEHVDLDTGEVNCTTLAEDAGHHFGVPDDDQDAWDDMFDWAFEEAETAG